MWIDALLTVCASKAFSTDAPSDSSIDLGTMSPVRGIGTGEPMCFAISIEVYATGGGAFEFRAIQSASADLSNPDILAAIFPAATDMPTGALLFIPIPPGSVTKRYIGVYFNNVSGTTTVTVSAELIPMSMIQSYRTYAKGYSVQ